MHLYEACHQTWRGGGLDALPHDRKMRGKSGVAFARTAIGYRVPLTSSSRRNAGLRTRLGCVLRLLPLKPGLTYRGASFAVARSTSMNEPTARAISMKKVMRLSLLSFVLPNIHDIRSQTRMCNE